MTQEAAKKERVAKVIEVLNKARSMELYAVHQYMNQHYNLDDLDYGEFASKIKLIAIDEMRHAEQFAERIKELGGEPNSELSSKITKGQKVMDVFPFNVKVEDDTIETYNKLLETCRTNGDSVSARLFERILDEEQADCHKGDAKGTEAAFKSLLGQGDAGGGAVDGVGHEDDEGGHFQQDKGIHEHADDGDKAL